MLRVISFESRKIGGRVLGAGEAMAGRTESDAVDPSQFSGLGNVRARAGKLYNFRSNHLCNLIHRR
jgi:hypothetical protein